MGTREFTAHLMNRLGEDDDEAVDEHGNPLLDDDLPAEVRAEARKLALSLARKQSMSSDDLPSDDNHPKELPEDLAAVKLADAKAGPTKAYLDARLGQAKRHGTRRFEEARRIVQASFGGEVDAYNDGAKPDWTKPDPDRSQGNWRDDSVERLAPKPRTSEVKAPAMMDRRSRGRSSHRIEIAHGVVYARRRDGLYTVVGLHKPTELAQPVRPVKPLPLGRRR